MKIFKCYHCLNDKQVPGRDFIAELPVCPKCGVDGREPQTANLIVPCRLIHFETPHPVVAGLGSGHLACDAKPTPGVMVTRELAAANCPNCLESEAAKKAQATTAAGVDDFVPKEK